MRVLVVKNISASEKDITQVRDNLDETEGKEMSWLQMVREFQGNSRHNSINYNLILYNFKLS